MSIRDDLKAYLDGELGAERSAEVAGAIQADPVLKEEADELRCLSQHIKSFATTPDPVGIERTLRAVQPKRPWWSPSGNAGWLVWGGAAAALILIAFSQLLPRTGGLEMASADSTAAKFEAAPDAERARTPAASANPAPVPLEPDAAKMKSYNGASAGGKDDLEPPRPNAIAHEAPVGSMPDSIGGIAENPRDRDAKFGVTALEPFSTDLEIVVPNQAAAQVRAAELAGPLGGSAQIEGQRVVIQVPARNFEGAMKELRTIGSVKESPPVLKKVPIIEGQDRGVGEADQIATINATFVEEDRQALDEMAEEPNGVPWLPILLGLAGVALGGVLWSLRRRS